MTITHTMTTIKLRAKPELGVDSRSFVVFLTSESAESYYGRPEANPVCPLVVWPKVAWEEVTP